jgi:hypothetical protein
VAVPRKVFLCRKNVARTKPFVNCGISAFALVVTGQNLLGEVLGQWELLSIVGKIDVIRQSCASRLVFKFVAHVREQRTAWLEATGDLDRLIQSKMRDVRIAPQRVENKYVQISQQLHAFRRDLVRVGAIGDVADAKSEYLEIWTVPERNRDNLSAQEFERLAVDVMNLELRHAAWVKIGRWIERIVERSPNAAFYRRLAIQRHGPAKIKLLQPQVIQSKNVVGVLMRIQHGMDHPNLFAQQLMPKVGRGIDQQVSAGQPKHCGTAGASVLRIVTMTYLAAAPDRWHADRGPGAQQDHLPSNVRRMRRTWQFRFQMAVKIDRKQSAEKRKTAPMPVAERSKTGNYPGGRFPLSVDQQNGPEGSSLAAHL